MHDGYIGGVLRRRAARRCRRQRNRLLADHARVLFGRSAAVRSRQGSASKSAKSRGAPRWLALLFARKFGRLTSPVFERQVMSNSPATSTGSLLSSASAPEELKEARLAYFDHPAGQVLRRLDDLDQNISLMLRSLEERMAALGGRPLDLDSQCQSSSRAKLPLSEIVGIVVGTAFVTGTVCVGLVGFGFWLR
jgi:hypothetical protein